MTEPNYPTKAKRSDLYRLLLAAIDQRDDARRQLVQDAYDARRYRMLRSMHWEDGGIVVVEDVRDVKLGGVCLSGDHLDALLDSLLPPP